MGFSWFPPRPDLNLALQTIGLWSTRADAALIAVSPPWDSLLAGRAPDSLVRNELGLANYYRARGLRVIVSVDPTNGLDRSAEAPSLVAAGRSLTEPAVRPPDMFIAGDDAEAKKKVTEICTAFGWPGAIDLGGIE